MKIENSNQSTVIASEGVQATSSFNIARTPHMFNILSSGLYSDKISAVLREIGCNAVDAHIMAGRADRPIQVKLPSPLDRSFYVKDWGPGLDDREVTELYTTYGWSSKQDNDLVTGAFGLGSKSPFAYTLQNKEDADGFTIESVKDGVKRIYTCHISEAGSPAISRLYEGPADADWPSGVKVSFPVQGPHISEFHEKAVRIFQWFAVLPEVLGLPVPLSAPAFKVSHDHFLLSMEENHQGSGVVMGNVRYPLDQYALRDVTKTETALINSGIVLKVPMGTVMMTPSREGLEYTDRTRKGVHHYLGLAVKEIAKTIYATVTEPATNNWEWYKRIQAYYTSLPGTIRNTMGAFLQEMGMVADDTKRILAICNSSIALLPKWVGNTPERGEPGAIRVTSYTLSDTREQTVRRRTVISGKIWKNDVGQAVGFNYLTKVAVFYGDSKTLDKRMRQAVREEGYTSLLLVDATDQALAKEYAERIATCEELNGIPLLAASSIVLPVMSDDAKRELREARKSVAAAVKHLTARVYDVQSESLIEVLMADITEKQKFFVYETAHGRRRGNRSYLNSQDGRTLTLRGGYYGANLDTLAEMCAQLPSFMDGIVVLSGPKEAKKLRVEELGFTPALFALEEQICKPTVWDSLVKNLSPALNLQVATMHSMASLGAFGVLTYHLRNKTDFGKILELTFSGTSLYQEMKAIKLGGEKECPKLEAIRTIASTVEGLKLPGTVQARGVHEVRSELEDKYPALGFLYVQSLQSVKESGWPDLLQMLKPSFLQKSKAPHLTLLAA